MKLFRSLVLALLLAALIGCSSGRAVTVKTAEISNRESWVGRSAAELDAVWGKADRTRPDGIGGSILTYTQVRRIKGSARVGPATQDDTVVGEPATPFAKPDTAGTALETDTVAEFRIDKDGKIYRYRMAPELLGKRELKPPAAD